MSEFYEKGLIDDSYEISESDAEKCIIRFTMTKLIKGTPYKDLTGEYIDRYQRITVEFIKNGTQVKAAVIPLSKL